MANWIFTKKNITDDLSADVVESLVFGAARQQGGIYGQRLLVRLVMEAQQWFRPIDFKDKKNLCKIEVGEWGDAKLEFSLRDFLSGERDNNYTKVKKALLRLLDTKLIYETEKKWSASNILTSVDLEKEPGKVTLEVKRDIWNAMLDFTKGYLAYNPYVALSLKNECSLFFYKRLTNQKGPVVFPVEELKTKLGLENKYPRTSDFIKRVIEPAKKELDAKSPFSFTYLTPDIAPGKTRKRTAHLTHLTIMPQRRLKNMSRDEARKMVHPIDIIGKDNYRLLCDSFCFDFRGIKANIKLFEDGVSMKGPRGFYDFLKSLTTEARNANTPQGYVINSVKRMCARKSESEPYSGILFPDFPSDRHTNRGQKEL